MNNIKATYMTVIAARLSRTGLKWRAFALALLLSAPMLAAAGQQTFANPEEAVAALAAACKAGDDAALLTIFGDEHKPLFVSSDRVQNSAMRAKVHAGLTAFHRLEEPGPDRRILLIGDQAWPLPIPIVREKDAWRFATELGVDEMINRRIGSGERNAMQVMRAYLDAQRQYASRDRNGDDVLEYAQKLGSAPGKQDGLYWPADLAKGEEASPLGPLVAASEEYLKGRKLGDPFRGYYFRILTRQGKSAPGGAYGYLINGRMIAGFGLIAYPADYGVSGIMTFIISNSGKIHEKDLGPETPSAVRQIKEYSPDASWKEVKEGS